MEVSVYDKFNKLIGVRTLDKAREEAKNQGMDLILKTLSTKIPVVQITEYKLELLRGFYQRFINSNVELHGEIQEEDFDLIEIKQQIGISDLNLKISKIKELVIKKNAAIRVFIRVNATSKIDIAKANFLLENIAEQLKGIGEITKKKSVQYFKTHPQDTSEILGEEQKKYISSLIEKGEEIKPEPDVDFIKKKKKEEIKLDDKQIGYVSFNLVPNMNEETKTRRAVAKYTKEIEAALKLHETRSIKQYI